MSGDAHDTEDGYGQPFGLCWGQQWSWHEHQVPASRRHPGLTLRDLAGLPGGIDRGVVRAAVRVLLSRHTSLRTSFSRDAGGRPLQRIWPVGRERYELRDFDDAGRCREWLERPLDILAGWPLRVALVCPDTGGPASLGVAVHHVAADMFGFRLLCEELRHVAGALARGEEPSLPDAGRQPADIAAFERSPAGLAANERAIAYWLDGNEQLADVMDSLRIRYGEPNDVMHVARVVSASGRRRVAEHAAAVGSSEPAVAVAAVACALAGHLGRATFPMTMSVSNRHLPGLARTVCSVAQSGLIRASVPDPRDLASAIPDAWAGMLGAIQHAYYDGDELSERMSAFDSGGLHLTAAPPNVNVAQVPGPDPGIPSGDAADGPWTSRVRHVAQRCLSLYFHVRLSESHLTIELRAGGHLLSADDSLGLVADAMALIHQ